MEGNETLCDGLCLAEDMIALAAAQIIQNQVFSGRSLKISAADVEVRNCEFTGWSDTAGIVISGSARRPWIHDSYFHDNLKHSAIYIGVGANTASQVIAAKIESNRFVNIRNTVETIAIKSSGNLIRNNTDTNSVSKITCRQGSNNTIEANRINGSKGITVLGSDHKILGNILASGSYIRIAAGNRGCGIYEQGTWPAACNTLVRGNSGGLIVGHQENSRCTIPAQGTKIESHTGSISYRTHQAGTTLNGNPVG
jgi:hypothetical protein